MTPRRRRRPDGSFVNSRPPWTQFPQLYEQTLKALDADPLWSVLRETPPEMWLIPPRGNPKKRRNGALRKALRGIGLTKLQIDDVIRAGQQAKCYHSNGATSIRRDVVFV